MTQTWWAEYAWIAGDRTAPGVVIETEDDRIASVTPGVAAPPSRATRLAGLTLPGMANGHSHAFHRALRARTESGTGSFWSWRESMYKLASQLDPDLYRRLARAVYAEMVSAGFTAVGEFHYLHHGPGGAPYTDGNEMGSALLDAASEAGIRMTLIDTLYLKGGYDTDAEGPQLRFCDADSAAWAERVSVLKGGANVVIAAGIHSVRAVPEPDMAAVVRWADDRAAPLHAHVSEQAAEHDGCIERFGTTPLGLLHRAGALGARFSAVHGTRFTPDDISLLAGQRGACCVCPTTESELGDGIGPFDALADAGVRICVGSDSNAVIDGLAEARSIEGYARLQSKVRGVFGPGSLLDCATSAGMRSLGWDAGSLRPGLLADFVAVRLDSVRTAGTDPNDAATAVFAASAADVHAVVVGGRQVVSDGHNLLVSDAASELRETIAELDP
jgi:formiminoglutamate deiminase